MALNLKKLVASKRIVDLDAGKQRGEAFLRINPPGAIPARVDHKASGELPITQFLTILAHLEDVHPAVPLLPSTPCGWARVRSLASMLVSDPTRRSCHGW